MRWLLILAGLFMSGALLAAEPAVKELEVRKIWDGGAHNAFTDLIRFRDEWYCSFREGADHAKGAGKLRVLQSKDGKDWKSTVRIETEDVDLRDPKLSVMPDGRLMMVGGAAKPASRDPVKDHYSFVSFSKDGAKWTEPQRVLESWQWLWRITWHKGVAYGVAYQWDAAAKSPKTYKAALYQSKDGVKFEKVTEFDLVNPTEATLAFDGDTMLCLQRRDGQANSAQLGVSEAPYQKWTWKDLGVYFGGPNLVRLPGGEWLAAGRMMEEKKAKTVLCHLDVKAGKLKPLHTLPSGGDNSYPGLVWHKDELWMSYYSSHEQKTSIYLARFQVK